MRVAGRKGDGQRPGLLRRLVRRQIRRTVTGAGVLALAVPLAWPSGAAGQHLPVPSASSVRSGAVRLADFVTSSGSPAPAVPVQQEGTAAGAGQRVAASQTSGLKHATGHAAGTGKGQLPGWAGAHGPSGSPKGTFTAGPAVRGFDPATSTLVAADTTAQSDTYQNADGSLTRKVWSTPVNYQSSSGTWTKVDDSLVRGASGRWQAKASSVAVSFAASGGDSTLSSVGTSSGSEQVSFALAGAGNVTATASGTSVTYPGILPSTDATETALPDGMSESLTLASPAAGTSWTFPLTLKGLTASLDGSTVDLTDAAGKLAGYIPPATATSGPVNLADPGAQATSQLTYQLVTVNGAPALQMSLDPAWLNAPGRVFPVTVDPTVNLETSGTTFTQAQNGTPQTGNNSGSTLLRSGTVTTSSTYSAITLAGFSALESSYPNAHLTSASLKIFNAYASQCTSAASVSAYQVTSSWSPSQSLTYPGPSYGTLDAQWTGTAAADACANTSGLLGKGSWLTLPFNTAGVSLLNQWTANSAPNWGFALVTSLSNSAYWKYFDSYQDSNVPTSQGTDCGVPDCRPYLQLNYSTTASDITPQVNSQFPANNTNVSTLTPELMASGSDADNWPSSTLQYDFNVYKSDGTPLFNTGNIASSDWQVPGGLLSWGQTYYWTVQAYDGAYYSQNPQLSYFSTPVPQPLITSQLAQNPAGPGFNPQTGNWTTSATDAQVATVGPALQITRDYNSADPRLSGAFGAGWSSVLDMKVSAGESGGAGTATQVVTYPDGEEVGFGLNANGSYSPPPGRYATLTAVSGGFTLTDKNDTVYKFTQAAGTGVYAITSITDALLRTETFTYTSGQVTAVTAASGRKLTVSWATPSGAAYPHVSSVVTDDAVSGNSSTAQTWGYHYSGDSLSSACPPASATQCTAYTYTAGSDYPAAVLDSGPQSYWRLDETSGSQANSAVLANEGSDVAAYYQVTQGTDAGPLPGSAAKAATLNGTSSYVVLPSKLVSGAASQSVSMWFKSSSPNGVLFSYQAQQIFNGSTTARNAPTLYIGADGKLNAEYYNGTAAPITTPGVVDDGHWHLVTLSASGNSQTLYLDGAQVGSALSGAISTAGMADNYVGTGYIGNSWPDEQYQGSSTAYPEYFHGDISDVGFWTRNLTAAEAKAMYTAGSHPAALLTTLTRPSHSVYAQVSYDPLTGRVTSDTDHNGGTWAPQPPTVSGSSQVYVGSVYDAQPQDYWRLNDIGGTWANDSANYCGCAQPAVYSNANEGVTNAGPFTDSQVAGLNGSNAFLSIPATATASNSPGTVGMWFETTGTNEVLYSEETGPVTGGAPSAFDPVLYVGNDGKLNGEFYDGNTTTAHSSAVVNDGKWHYAVLAAGSGTQALYVDGALQGTISGNPSTEPWTNAAAGAGFLGGSWPDTGSSTVTAKYFNGDLAELAWYPYQLAAWQVSYQWNAAQQAQGLTPVETSTVTVPGPGNHTLTWTYDLRNGGRVLSQTDADGGMTSYGYDTGGFQNSVTDPNGHTIWTGHDPRGNMVSQTTCQNQSANQCSTSYWTYYPNDTATQPALDARNDMVQTSADGRSASSSDTTYQTSYTYDTAGDLVKVTTPPVSGYPSGRSTVYLYTSGTSTGGYLGAVPPKGLPYQVTTPGGAVTTTLYNANGDAAQVTDPDGKITQYTYDGLGRKIKQAVITTVYSNPGLVTTYTYDANGNAATQTDPAVTDRVTGAVHTLKITTGYDPDGEVTSQVTADLTGGDASRTASRTYNGFDQLATQTDAASNVTRYTYDAYGNIATETDPDGNLTQYAYDGDGHLTSTTLAGYTGSPPGSQSAVNLVVESRSYDPAGRLAYVADAMNRTAHYTYTDNNLLAGIDATPGPTDWSQDFTTEWYSYDGAGNKTEEWSNNGQTDTQYTVDAASRVTQQVTDPSGLDRTTAVAYTPDDEQASVTQTGSGGATRTVSDTYDPAGNVLTQSVTDPGSDGPVAWWNLSQSSGTAVPDWISGGQPANASGVTWDSSEGTFSGTSGSQVATAGPVLDTEGSFTVAGWVNLAVNNLGHPQVVASQAAGKANGFTLGYDQGSGDWQFGRPLTDTTSPSVAAANSGTATTGVWTFLAGTYNASTGAMTLYVNGTLSGTATDATPIAAHGAFTIGSAKTGGSQGDWFDGQAADIQVYPRTLSAAEVQQLYGISGDITTSTLVTSITRDQRGLPASVTDPDGATTTYSYDEAGQLAVTTAPPVTTQVYGGAVATAGPYSMTGYNTFGDTVETKDPDGNITHYGFDADSQPVSTTLPGYTPPGSSTPVTPVRKTAYDGDGLVTSTTDGLNYTTYYTYDQLGDQVTEKAPDNSVTTTAYDADGEPLSVTGPTGAVTGATYDYLGRLHTSTQVERYSGSGTAGYTTQYAYGDTNGLGGGGGWLSQVTSPDGVITKYGYDAAHETTAVTDGASNTTSYAFDALGQQTKVTYPDGTATATGYDGAGNPVSTTSLDSSGNTLAATSAAYDGNGDLLSSTDAAGNSSTFTYDPTGLVSQEFQPVSATSGITTSFGYDPAGNQTQYTDGNGTSWWDTYNSWGLQEKRIEPYVTGLYTTLATSTFTTAYDADQNPVTLTEPGATAVTVTSTYNNLGELTGQSGAGAEAATPTRTFGYDTAGNLTSAATSNTLGTGSNATSETFIYNDRGQELTATGSGGPTSYAYNGDGLVTSVANAAGTTSYTYDTADRLGTLKNPATGATGTYTYNSDSLLTGVSYGSGNDSLAYGYNSLHQMTSDTLKTSSGSTVASIGYGYNADGEIASETTAGLAGPASSTYTYDEAGRLASWNNGTTTTQYGYDANGNLTRNGSKTLAYDARDELTSDGTGSYTYTYTARGTPSSEPGTGSPQAAAFDAYGDQATAGSRSYAYDALGRLAADTASTGTQYAFSYVGSTGAVASDGTTAYTWDPSGSVLVAAGAPGGGTGGKLALTNAHGDLVGQFTAAGTSVPASKAYDPWGTVTATTGTITGLLGYQSAWTDTSAGKSLMGARWYNPGAGNFTSADTVQVNPVPDSAQASPFAYAGDDPLDLTDPSGHMVPNSGDNGVTCAMTEVICIPVLKPQGGTSTGNSGKLTPFLPKIPTTGPTGSPAPPSGGELAGINQALAAAANKAAAKKNVTVVNPKQVQSGPTVGSAPVKPPVKAPAPVKPPVKAPAPVKPPVKAPAPVKTPKVSDGSTGGSSAGGGPGNSGPGGGPAPVTRPQPATLDPTLSNPQISYSWLMTEIGDLTGPAINVPADQGPQININVPGDQGPQININVPGDQGPSININVPGDQGPQILTTPEMPDLTGTTTVKSSDSGGADGNGAAAGAEGSSEDEQLLLFEGDDLRKAPGRKTMGIAADTRTLSGWVPAEMEGFSRVSPEEMLAFQELIGHPTVMSGAADRGLPGAYLATHAERQAAVLKPNTPIEVVGNNICPDCHVFFQNVANYRGVAQQVTDASGTYNFYPGQSPP
jgi:large repetitive protein